MYSLPEMSLAFVKSAGCNSSPTTFARCS